MKTIICALVMFFAVAYSFGQSQDSLKNDASGKNYKFKQPLFILEGKEITQLELQAVTPEDIQSIEVLKDSSATNLYGERGRHGVIIVHLKAKKK